MACEKRQRTGTCSHHQCPAPTLTEYGYECVDTFAGYCEVGLNCIPQCKYSFTDAEVDNVNATIKAAQNQ